MAMRGEILIQCRFPPTKFNNVCSQYVMTVEQNWQQEDHGEWVFQIHHEQLYIVSKDTNLWSWLSFSF